MSASTGQTNMAKLISELGLSVDILMQVPDYGTF